MDLNVSAGLLPPPLPYNEILAIFPCLLLGFLVGVANYYKPFIEGEKEHKPSIKKFMGCATSSAVISFIIFAMLDSTNFTFLTKLSISSAVAFLGIDKAIEIAHKVLSLRGGRNE